MRNIQDYQQMNMLMAQLGRTCAHGSTVNDRTFDWKQTHYRRPRTPQNKGSAK